MFKVAETVAPSKRSLLSDPKRQIILATFLATFVAYVERVGFSISFTALARQEHLDEAIKGSVLSAFYCGYGFSQIPGGWAAQLYGGRIMLILCFLSWATVSILTPTDARNTSSIVFARVLVGLAQGFLIPAVHTVLSQWVPPHEKARAVSFTTSGMYLGSAAAMSILPSVAAAFGAGHLLVVNGCIGLAWLVMWLVVARDSPRRETAIPLAVTNKGVWDKSRPAPTPWKHMLAHPAIWAIVVNNFSFHFAFYVVMNWMPTYFTSVLHADLAALGLPAKTLPYLTMFLMSNVGGWAGDWLILRRRYSTAAARKTVNTVGFILSAVMLMLMPIAKGVFMGVVATTLTLGSLGLARGGFSVNHMDIAPKYAGVVMGISNTAGTLSGVIGVASTGFILDSFGGATAIPGWFYAHALCACICLVAMGVFNAFARGERIFD